MKESFTRLPEARLSFWINEMTYQISTVFFSLILLLTFGCKSRQVAQIDFEDGAYEGTLDSKGRKHGRGIYRWTDGSIYEGSYKRDQRHGKGRFLWAGGESYEGDYLADERTGQGIYLWPDGARYEGSFKSGMRHGKGLYATAEGSVYEGEWFDDLQHGSGTLRTAAGKVQKGIWREGSLVQKPALLPSGSAKATLSESFAEDGPSSDELVVDKIGRAHV